MRPESHSCLFIRIKRTLKKHSCHAKIDEIPLQAISNFVFSPTAKYYHDGLYRCFSYIDKWPIFSLFYIVFFAFYLSLITRDTIIDIDYMQTYQTCMAFLKGHDLPGLSKLAKLAWSIHMRILASSCKFRQFQSWIHSSDKIWEKGCNRKKRAMGFVT